MWPRQTAPSLCMVSGLTLVLVFCSLRWPPRLSQDIFYIQDIYFYFYWIFTVSKPSFFKACLICNEKKIGFIKRFIVVHLRFLREKNVHLRFLQEKNMKFSTENGFFLPNWQNIHSHLTAVRDCGWFRLIWNIFWYII